MACITALRALSTSAAGEVGAGGIDMTGDGDIGAGAAGTGMSGMLKSDGEGP